MSLINQMLKDIESRSRAPRSVLPISGLNAGKSSQKDLVYNWKLILGISAIIFLSLFALEQLRNPTQQNIEKAHALSSVGAANYQLPTLSYTPKTALEHFIPSLLTGITFQTLQNTTSLAFSLSRQTLYRVNYDNEHDKVIIILEQSHLIASLPPINYQNSAIKNMEIINVPNTALKIIITLNRGAEVKNLQLTEKTKYPELRLDLYSSNEELTKDASANSSPFNTAVITQDNKSVKKLIVNMTIQEQYKNAINLMQIGEGSKALLSLQDIVETYPEYFLARESLAKLLIKNNQHKEANKILDIGLNFKPDYPPFLELKARLLTDIGQNTAALGLLQSNLPSIRENPNYYALLAALYQRQGQSMMAVKVYERLLSVNPNNAVWWVGLGIALDAINKHKDAMTAYLRANTSMGLTPELSKFIGNQIQET